MIPPGNCFDCSPAFQRALELRESCHRYQEMLLNAPPEELAAFWDDLLKG